MRGLNGPGAASLSRDGIVEKPLSLPRPFGAFNILTRMPADVCGRPRRALLPAARRLENGWSHRQKLVMGRSLHLVPFKYRPYTPSTDQDAHTKCNGSPADAGRLLVTDAERLGVWFALKMQTFPFPGRVFFVSGEKPPRHRFLSPSLLGIVSECVAGGKEQPGMLKQIEMPARDQRHTRAVEEAG